MGQIKYSIDEMKRVVVAWMEGCEVDAIYAALKPFKYSPYVYSDMMEKLLSAAKKRDFYIPSTFRGIAKCSPDDKWDVEYGKDLARSKMHSKYSEVKYRALMRINLYIRRNYIQNIIKIMDITEDMARYRAWAHYDTYSKCLEEGDR